MEQTRAAVLGPVESSVRPLIGCDELREWPDGDAAQVIAQLWAEEWVRKIDGPNEG